MHSHLALEAWRCRPSTSHSGPLNKLSLGVLFIALLAACGGGSSSSSGSGSSSNPPPRQDFTIECAEAATLGCWLPPFSEDGVDADAVGDFNAIAPATEAEASRFPAAVSVAVLPDRRIIYWNAFEGDDQLDAPRMFGGLPPPGSLSRSRVLNLSAYLDNQRDPRDTATWTVPIPEGGGQGDLFCSDNRFLPSGELLAVGGQVQYDLSGAPYGSGPHQGEYEGIKDVRAFDWRTNRWSPRAPMSWERWYPTLLNLPSEAGELMVTSGVYRLIFNMEQENVEETEIYQVMGDRWADTGSAGSQSLPLYPRLHLMPNGKVFYGGAGQMWNAFGQAKSQIGWIMHKWFDPTALAWSDIGPGLLPGRNAPYSVLLPLRPDPASGDYRSATLLVGGGTIGLSPGTVLATNVVERINWSADQPNSVTSERAAAMPQPRWFGTAVVLPTGEVAVFSGADRDHLWGPGEEIAVREVALYDPDWNVWTQGPPAARDRTYHNTAVLLPDGSVLVGGHVPHPLDYGQRHETRPPGANNFRDPSFEIYRPPYLYRGQRPRISAAPETMPRSQPYRIQTSDAGATSLRVVLSRLPSLTHVIDADQRSVELPIVQRNASEIVVQAPASRAVLPDGYYYLFLTVDRGTGATASTAHIVHL